MNTHQAKGPRWPIALLCLSFSVGLCPQAGAAEEEKVEPDVAVSVAQITRMTLNAHVVAYGTVEPAPASADHAAASARIAPPVAGLVLLAPVFEGQHVEKGAALVQLDGRAAEAAVLKAQSGVTLAERALSRQKQLRKAESTSDKLYQEAEQQLAAAECELAAARVLQSMLVVTAPFAGTVTRVNVRPGETADPATPVIELFSPDRLVVAGGVPAADAAALKLGRPAEIAAQIGQHGIKGTLIYISPQVDAKTGSVPVRVSVPADAGLRPGQYVKLTLATEEHPEVLAAPIESVVKDPEKGYVLAFVTENKAVQKPVELGLRDGEWVEVRGENVKVGATIVSVGAYGLPKETKIRVVAPGRKP